jgi:TonB-linked SusC/RagA family outer membrane protein
MRIIYLLFGWTFLLVCNGMTQSMHAYADTGKPLLTGKPVPVRMIRTGITTLKEHLLEVEKHFGISIAFKDEWVEGKQVTSISEFTSVEETLTSLLQDTGLDFKKSGERFYVLTPVKERHTFGSDLMPATATPLPNPLFTSDIRSQGVTYYYINESVQKMAASVSGTVTDEAGQPIPGVNVVIKGTSTGSTTDSGGKFVIDVPDESTVLVFSFVGFETQEVTVGSRTVVDITMKADIKQLSEVVVTALGIEKPSKSLGYATSKVDGKELIENRTPNMMNSLQGKVAGVNISSLGTGPGGTSKVRIRGQSSMSGQNNPLIVVNGVPIDNTNFGTNQGNLGADGAIASRGGGASTDGGDGLTSFNPDDIESMQVLKGATAAALYGSRAKDGVIMITTKSKGTSQGIGISYNLNYTTEQVLDFTDYQYDYGQGEYGGGPAAPNATPNPTSGQWSFGRKIQPGMTQVLFDNVVVPYEAQKDILSKFYRTGKNVTNSVSISSSTDKGGLNFSFSNLDSKGITPNNKYTRNTINLGFGYDLSEKLSVRGNINYSNEYNKNPPVVSDQDNSIPTSLYAMANTMPLDVLNENKYNPGGGEYLYSRFTNRTNPYWVLEEVKQNIRRDRLFGNFSIKYDLTNWLSIQARGGQDYWSRDSDYINLPTGKASISSGSIFSVVNTLVDDGGVAKYVPVTFYNGLYTQEARRFRETNYDFLITAAKDFGDFGVNVNMGGNQMRRRMDLNSVQVTDFVVKDLYTVQNGRAKDPLYELNERGVNSLYAMAEGNYKEIIYLNATFRQDWFTTLSKDDRTITYPSISTSYVFSESFGSKPRWMDFGKFRAAYAKVGSDSDVAAYSNVLLYNVNGQQFQGSAVGNFGLTVPNANLRPMSVEETELGLELKTFGNRVNLDVAVYNKLTTDQIVSATISDASGFNLTQINSGRSENKGIEIMLNLVPVTSESFQWDFTFTGAYNKTKVLSLLTDEPGKSITVGQHVFNGWVNHVVGEELGQIVGYGYRRNDSGQIIYGANGLPLPTTAPIAFGSALPKWTGGFMNTFTYKGLIASFLIDFKLGGKLLSGTNFNAYRHGLHQETLVGREGGVLDAGGNDPGNVVGVGVNEAGEPNTKGAKAQDYYSVVRGSGLVEPIIYNAGYWKLRQINIGYDFSKFIPDSFPIRSIRLSLVANNVLMLKKWAPNIDPESFSYSSDNVSGLESPSVPTTRSIGFNLNVKL